MCEEGASTSLLKDLVKGDIRLKQSPRWEPTCPKAEGQMSWPREGQGRGRWDLAVPDEGLWCPQLS